MKPQHHTFIRECILHGDKHRAYKTAYPNASGEALKIAARRLYRRPEIKQVIEEAMAKARQQAVANLEVETADFLEQELATLKLKRQVLLKMMAGAYKIKRHIRVKDRIEEVADDLSAFAVLRAIELDTKLINNWFERTKPIEAKTKKAEQTKTAVPSPSERAEGELATKPSTPLWPLPTAKYISPYDDEYIGCRFDPKDPNTKVQFAWSMKEQERQREERRKKAEQTLNDTYSILEQVDTLPDVGDTGFWENYNIDAPWQTIQNDTISSHISFEERPWVRPAADGGVEKIPSPLSLGEGPGVRPIQNDTDSSTSPLSNRNLATVNCQLQTADCEKPDLWKIYITHDRNTARLPKDDRAAKEHWFRNKTIQNQLKLIELYKDKTA